MVEEESLLCCKREMERVGTTINEQGEVGKFKCLFCNFVKEVKINNPGDGPKKTSQMPLSKFF